MLADHIAARKPVLAMQDRCQVAPFDHMGFGGAANGIHEGGGKVDHLHQLISDEAPRAIGIFARVGNDQRHLHGHLVVEILVAHPVITHVVAVVRCEGDDGIFAEALFIHPGEQAAKVVIQLLDQPHIGGDHMFAHMITSKAAADPRIKIGLHQGMIGLPFGFGSDWVDDVPLVIHVVIGCGHDIGPMRLDIGEVTDPGPPVLLGRFHKCHGAVGHIGSFRMLLWHIGRKA